MKEETEYKDGIIHSTKIQVDVWQRIRFLFGKRLYYSVVIKTENKVGKILVTDQFANVEHFVKPKSIGGMIEVKDDRAIEVAPNNS